MTDIDKLTQGASQEKGVMPKLRCTAGGERNILHRDDPLYMAENASQQVIGGLDGVCLVCHLT